MSTSACPMNVWNHTNGCDCASKMSPGAVATATFPSATPGLAPLSAYDMASLPDVGSLPREVDRAGFEQALAPGGEYVLKQNGVDVGEIAVGEHKGWGVHVKFPGSDSDSTGPIISASDRFVVDEKGSAYVIGDQGTADFEFHPKGVRRGQPDLSRLPESRNARPLARERLGDVLPVGVKFRQRNIAQGRADNPGISHVVTIKGASARSIAVDYGNGSGGPILGERDSFACDERGNVYLMNEQGEPYLMYEPY